MARKNTLAPSTPGHFYELFIEASEQVDRLFDEVAQRAKANPTSATWNAFAIASTIGCRHLRVARLLFESGWAPETRLPLRGAWESAIDLAFLMSGTERYERARKYVAMMLLRYPNLLTNASTPVPPAFEERLRRLGLDKARSDFGNDPGVKAEHWSGLHKSKVREAAAKYLEEHLQHVGARGRQYVAGLIKGTKDAVFDTGSTFVHSDPASYVVIASGTPLTRAAEALPWDIGGAEPAIACTVATLIVIPLAHRLRRLEVAEQLSKRFHGLVIRG